MRAFWMRLFSGGWGKERLDLFARSRSARWCEHRSLPAFCWSKRQLCQWERFSDCIGWLRLIVLEYGRTVRSRLQWCTKILSDNPGYRSDVWKVPMLEVGLSEDDSRDHPYCITLYPLPRLDALALRRSIWQSPGVGIDQDTSTSIYQDEDRSKNSLKSRNRQEV